jgi:hypothetical protein
MKSDGTRTEFINPFSVGIRRKAYSGSHLALAGQVATLHSTFLFQFRKHDVCVKKNFSHGDFRL